MTMGQSRLPLCVIVEPTIELANQVVEELGKFSRYLQNPKIHTCAIVGRRDTRDILRQLGQGLCDIVVGTPGKLQSFMDEGKLILSQCRFMVLDEADRLGTDNLKLVTDMYSKISVSSSSRLQVCMFSATLHSEEIKKMQERLCPRALWIDMKGKDYVPETVHHVVVRVDPYEARFQKMWAPNKRVATTDGVHDADMTGGALKGDLLDSYGLKCVKPQVLLEIIRRHKMEQCMVFCRTRIDCDNVSKVLTEAGGGRAVRGRDDKGKENMFSNVVLHSGITAAERAANLDLFTEGYARFLICTDVAARGIDIRALPCVINMTLPDKTEDYLHRVGRTGRAGRMGLAISVVAEKHNEKVWYHTCPNRGEGCTKTTLAHLEGGRYVGGCCIWYKEHELLAAIEAHLGHPIDKMENDFKLPASLQPTLYGQTKEEVKTKQKRDPFLEANEIKLVAAEHSAQNSFFGLILKSREAKK
eukprot:PhM_4_TR3044/c3_g1_i3/m.45532/K13177/DDX1; ATP-dependent RNA helicase DDX1